MRALFIALLCIVSASAAAQDLTWPDPVANHVIPRQSTPVTHGPVLGAVTSNSVRLWLRADREVAFDVLVTPHRPPFDEADVTTGRTIAAEDFTGYVEIDGLEPNTVYAYAVRVDGELIDLRVNYRDPWPTFRTLPDETSFAHEFNPEGRFNLSFSIGACQRQRSPEDTYGIYANPPAFDTMWEKHRDRLAFHIINGDYTYEETIDGTVAGIENNYKLYLDRGRSLNRLLRHVPMMTMYNDHEVTDNIDGSGEVGLGNGNYLVRDPALRVWQYYADWANAPGEQRPPIQFGNAQLEAGSDVLHDPDADFSKLDLEEVSTLHIGHFLKGGDKPKVSERGGRNVGVYAIEKVIDATHLQIRPALKATGNAPYSIGRRHWFDRVIGNCHFIFLDTRGQRSEWKGVEHSHDADRFVLGEPQKRWFLETVRESKADFLFVISPDPWFLYHSAYHVRPNTTTSKGDGYCGYVHEREELTEVLDRLEKPVLLLTGDVHQPVAAQISDNVWEFLVSPVNSANHPIGTLGLPPLGGWFDSEGRTIKIKWLGGYPDNVHYQRQRHTVYAVISVNNIVKAPRQEGPGYQFLAYDAPQVVVQFRDGYTGELLYAEGISTLDALPPGQPAEKRNRFGHWRE
ncbi:PhoD-like phosphatase [Maioricimonas rarisocia]|uniref:PhoD-like phosphatase n=1 Tax=Maioricimonas rarisocia TaxID=2528026 RepID=A0A517ZEN7_9PLAN|nr:alkaline phosphatase D family protein [Maioricimonas rarisocia]QDU40926.1 PhoD-like phosphatase [Maioricimonas rarisocia]